MKLRNNKETKLKPQPIMSKNKERNVGKKKELQKNILPKVSVIKSARIQASNLFTIMGMNYFKKFDKVLSDIWKTYDKSDYENWVKLVESEGYIPATISIKKQLELFEKKHSDLKKLNLNNVLDKTGSMNNAEDMRQQQLTLIKQMKSTLPQQGDDKKKTDGDVERLERLMVTASNTKYGIKQEDNVISQFSKIIKKQINSTQKMFRHKFGELYGIDWSLVGKVDGITSDSEVVEIKNRTKGLFGELRSYEKPQIMTYLRLNGSENGYLVECFRKRDGTVELGIVNVKYEDGYFECDVIPAIDKFTRFFSDFINDDNLKRAVIKGEEGMLYDKFQSY